MPLTPVPDTSAPTFRRVFHKESGTHTEDAVTFDCAGLRIELVMGEQTLTIASFVPGEEKETLQQIELPRSAAPVFVHPETQELLIQS